MESLLHNRDVALQRLYYFYQKNNMDSPKIACIFDMDGTLTDNIPTHHHAWKAIIAHYNLTYRAEIFNTFTSNKDIFCALFERELPEAEWMRYTEEKEEMYRANYRPIMKPVKGLRRFLQSLRKNDVSMGIGTAAYIPNVDFIMDGLKLRPYFQTIIDVSMVTKAKPDPEVFLKAAQKLGIAPKHCVVFEDSIPGVHAGKNAGMTVVAVTTTHTAEELAHADYLIKDYTEVSFEKIKSWLS
jgi:beta-phosphoglucomutase family hydrolase